MLAIKPIFILTGRLRRGADPVRLFSNLEEAIKTVENENRDSYSPSNQIMEVANDLVIQHIKKEYGSEYTVDSGLGRRPEEMAANENSPTYAFCVRFGSRFGDFNFENYFDSEKGLLVLQVTGGRFDIAKLTQTASCWSYQLVDSGPLSSIGTHPSVTYQGFYQALEA